MVFPILQILPEFAAGRPKNSPCLSLSNTRLLGRHFMKLGSCSHIGLDNKTAPTKWPGS